MGDSKKKVLIIGGTQFVGRHTVELLLRAGHDVVLVNRGRTGPDLFPSARKILCDRSSEEFYARLDRESGFDAVIDFCAYYPKDIERLVPSLSDVAQQYIQISSISACRARLAETSHCLRETDPLLECTKEEAIDTSPSTYGNRKAGCEQAALRQSRQGVPVTIFRPSVIYGRYDPTDRFAYWIWRVARQQPFLLPEDGVGITQRTYAPDFAQTIVSAVGNARAFHKAYNVAESGPLSLRATLAVIGRRLRVDPFKFAVPASAERLLEMQVKPWNDLPLWMPHTDLRVDTSTVREDLHPPETPTEQAIGEACDAFLEQGRQPSAGLSAERERGLVHRIQSREAGNHSN